MRVRVLFAAVAAAVVAGCGPSLATADGKVVLNGKAYNPETDGDMNIGLTPEGGGATQMAKVQSDGTFKIESGTGVGGIPVGKYKVSVIRYPSKEEMTKAKGPPMPKTKDTGEVWDVTSGKSFALDVSKAK